MQAKQDFKQNSKIPLISFIITCYNLPKEMLEECLDSILALSLRRYEREIILVDDGSEVCLMNELLKYGDDIVYIRKKNGGVSTARNIGMEIATGKYVQFVDGDDRLLQTPYEYCLDIIRYNESDIVMFDFTRRDDLEFNVATTPPPVSGTEYMHNNNIKGAVWCYLFRREMAGTLRFTPGIQYGEDEEFTPQLLLRAETVVHTDAKAYYYRENVTSVLNRTDLRSKVKRIDDNLNVIYNLLEKSHNLPSTDSIAMQRRIAQLTMDYIYNLIVTTHSATFVNRKLKELEAKGLFPLPDKNYTAKYKWFRRITNSKAGMTVLIHTLPLLKRER